MSLEIQRGKSEWWFARIRIDGRNLCRKLNVKIAGTVPAKLSDLGDILFERSRAQAQAEHDRMVQELRRQRTEVDLLESIYQAKTGAPVPTIPLSEMSDTWLKLQKRAAAYNAQAVAMHRTFIAYMSGRFPRAKTMADVREDMAREFMATIEADYLRSCFNALTTKAGMVKNPFADIEEQKEEIISRQPFSEEELKRILAVLQQDKHAFIRPALIVAINTAMRRADCCLLRKIDVDLAAGKITVRTAKTRKPIQIPLTAALRKLLDGLGADDSEYLFPALASQFRRNPKLITDRTKDVLHDAGFSFTEDGPDPRMAMSATRETGKGVRRASTRDFHSFRATWVTLALTAGVPIEMVCLVTGHTSADTLRKHYFLPGFEDFRRVLSAKLPSVIGGNATASIEKGDLLASIEAKLQAMGADNWRSQRTALIKMIRAHRSSA
jgi:integrase